MVRSQKNPPVTHADFDESCLHGIGIRMNFPLPKDPIHVHRDKYASDKYASFQVNNSSDAIEIIYSPTGFDTFLVKASNERVLESWVIMQSQQVGMYTFLPTATLSTDIKLYHLHG